MVTVLKRPASMLWQPNQIRLTRILHEGFGIYGQAGKACWTIARRCIAIAMDQGGSFKMRRQIGHKTK